MTHTKGSTSSASGGTEDFTWKLPETITDTTVLPRLEESPSGPTVVVESRRRYEPREKIGEGSAGDVELAMDCDINRLVAVKRLKKNLHNSMMLMRFVDEIRTVGHLEHPNIVPIHDVGISTDGQYYFVMKYVQGETLQAVIDKLKSGDAEYHKKYTFQTRAVIFSEILKGVEFAHYHRVIHRDIKPANIMVGPHGEVTLMDWGIARPLEGKKDQNAYEELRRRLEKDINEAKTAMTEQERMARTMNDSIVGTPAFMAPEQFSGDSEDHDERTDVYALCALFYEFLTLRYYLGPVKTLEELVEGVVSVKPKFPALVKNPHQSTVPADLAYYVMKGLEKEPDSRYASVKEMQAMLQRIWEGHTPVHCVATLSKRSLNFLVHIINKYPMTGTLMVLVLLLLVIGGGIALVNMMTIWLAV
ncbi:MAG: serine/threonine protein kinase [bacterium]|nr:serine/threonine protein kinase [bacterium]